MKEPSPRSSRLVIAGSIAAALLVAGGGFILGRATTERVEIVAAPPVARPTPAPVLSPENRRVLGRADLVALAARAADDFAAGADPVGVGRDVEGRRFEIRLPFGCDGPAAEDSNAAMRWRYDAEESALRIHVAPVAWTTADWWSVDEPGGIEAIEGFWLMRPWSSSEDCPARGAAPAARGAEAITLPGQTLAIAQFSARDSSRRGRRDGQPYQSVVRVDEGELDSSKGFRLRITGRIVRAPGEIDPVRCQQPAGAEQRPICVIAVTLEQVAVENGATGEIIATWDAQSRSAPSTAT